MKKAEIATFSPVLYSGRPDKGTNKVKYTPFEGKQLFTLLGFIFIPDFNPTIMFVYKLTVCSVQTTRPERGKMDGESREMTSWCLA